MSDAAADGNQGFRDLQQGPGMWPREPKPAPVFQRYPAMLRHPEHRDAVPARHETVRITPPGGLQVDRIEFIDTPGVLEQYPPIIVNSDAEVAAAIARGYTAPAWDEAAAAAAYNPPQVSDHYAPAEYPKYVASHGRIVHSEAEELRLTGGAPVLPPAPIQAPEQTPPLPQELLALRAEVAALRAAAVQPAQATPSIGTRNRTEAQARLVAGISHSVWRKLIRAGYLTPDRQSDPIAIVAAQEAMRQSQDAARIAAEQPEVNDERI